MLRLLSPFAGWAGTLAEVNDPAFAEGLLGEGIAVDPLEGVLRAPCEGEIVALAKTGHSVTVRADGVDILLHIGLDTVALAGEGFSPQVEIGRRVQAGEPLIVFDLDAVAARARSLVTPIVALGEGVEVRPLASGLVEAGDVLMELTGSGSSTRPAPSPPPAPVRSPEARRDVRVPLAHGIHARPAGRIAATARGFTSRLEIVRGESAADARSSVSLMGLGVRCGDTVVVRGKGADAEAAVATLAELIEGGMGEAAATPTSPAPAPAPVEPEASLGPGVLAGVTAAPGIAVGPVLRLSASEAAVDAAGRGEAVERAALANACAAVRGRLTRLAAGEQDARRAVLQAHLDLMDDPVLATEADGRIGAGESAGHAWRQAIRAQAEALRRLGDSRMAERIADLLDLETQVLRALAGEAEPSVLAAGDAPVILVADDLFPSQLIAFPRGALAGLATARGGPTSHVAILAAAMDVPALVAVGAGIGEARDGDVVILDADARRMRLFPPADEIQAARGRVAKRAADRAEADRAAASHAVTRDGERIEVFANIGSVADARAAVAAGAEGVGLLRTEFLFLDREAAPDEAEQAGAYQAILDALEGRPLIVRTLDIGGDKPAPYLPLPSEENPALGLRGVRVGLQRPEILKAQLRAVLRARPAGLCRIMLPMVSSLSELCTVRGWLDEARDDLGVDARVELGVMVETPAAAATADILAREADFLSIGTNDLTQYVLAMDRGHPELAARSDALHPAVLRLIAQTCAGAARHGRWTGVCGGLASDLLAAPLLVGLGVRELSCTPSRVAEVKATLRAVSLADCRAVARQALDAESPEAVRALARSLQPEGAPA